jgi:UDPglucose--hexose-1-phosphate uridylyltransferase
MSRLRLNPLTGRWVTISAERAARPSALAPRSLPVEAPPVDPCPFCPGHDDELTLPPIETYGSDGDWQVRVVPNRYPAFSGTEPMVVRNLGPVFSEATASGRHEVLVLTQDHRASWADLDDKQAGVVMGALRDRVEDHAATAGIRYTQVIVNHGREAGASLDHPHAQLLGIPFVPQELNEEENAFRRFVGGCLLCTTLEAEVEAGHRSVVEDDLVVAVCPFWSGVPYELLVIPRAHEGHLDHAKPADVTAVGRVLADVLRRLRGVVGEVAYNVVFHGQPVRHESPYHWHAHVFPRLTTRAGFEQGTGVLINVVPPEQAAADLRAAS